MEPKIYRVIKEYKSAYPDPIILKKGERVSVGRKYTDNSDWKGWQWCENVDGKKGWVPEQYINIISDTGIVVCNYSANELSVKVGDEITVYKKQNGWAWSKNSVGEYGWVPLKNIKI